MGYIADGKIGIDLTRTVSGTTTDGENAEFTLGTRASGTDNQEYIYVQADEAITQYDLVAIDENFQMSQLTATEAGDGWTIGAAQVAFSDNELGWVAVKGHNLQGRVGASCAADVALYTSGTAGVVDDATGGTKIDGIVAVGANTPTTAGNVEILMTYPRSATF